MKEEPQREENQDHRLEQDICIHIFTVSSAMVGVCLTVIGLIRVVITLGSADTIADEAWITGVLQKSASNCRAEFSPAARR